MATRRAPWGLVIGKFWPPHAGHLQLIERALAECARVTVVVCERPDQTPPPAAQRAAWLRELCPGAEVLVVPDIGYDDDSARWATYTREFLGRAPDVVFTSESYGDAYAHFLGARHVSVDPGRTAALVSGTAVRCDPLRNWRYLPPPVRAFYAVRVSTIGAESTGTTTLATDLAASLGTTWVPEYGREYSIEKADGGDDSWTSDEFAVIAAEQARREDLAARTCEHVLVCDTDAFATSVWHERYIGERSPIVERIAEERRQPGTEIDLYLLTDIDIPFVQDGYRDGEHIREWMHRRFVERLTETGRPFLVVSGTPAERLAVATATVRLLTSQAERRTLSPAGHECVTWR
jgi:HTH-type transcriptional regulator, transcriptional repressor of NAD biosynthesis genes